MERHIKQQHPQHWSQKPRGSRRNHTATVPVLAPQFRNQQELGGMLPSNSDEKMKDQHLVKMVSIMVAGRKSHMETALKTKMRKKALKSLTMVKMEV